MSRKTIPTTTLFDGESSPPNTGDMAPNITDASEHLPAASEHSTGNTLLLNPEGDNYFPPRPKLLMLPLDKVTPSPLNPRKHFDEAGLEELADSIRAHGVQQPIVVRQHVQDLGTQGGQVSYSIVMGERRWRASKIAAVPTIPAIVRTDLNDLAHAELALEENLRRKDLTVMEEARGYALLMELGRKQADIGKGKGVGQSRISNMTRLLELPADVQALIEDGTLKAGHGIALARYAEWPKLCSAIAAKAAQGEMSVRSLEGDILPAMTEARADGLFVCIDAYPKPKFDWETICKACPFGAYRKERDHAYCLRPDHYALLDREANVAADDAARAEAERLRAEAERRQSEAIQAAAAATTPAERKQAEADGKRAQSAAAALQGGLPTTEYGKIERIGPSDPDCCQRGECPCNIKAMDRYAGGLVNACANPEEQRKVKAAQTKAANVGRKDQFDAVREQVDAAATSVSPRQMERMAAITSWFVLRNAKQDAKRHAAARLSIGPHMDDLRALLERRGYDVPDAEAWAVLAEVDITEQVTLTAAVLAYDELLQRYEYGDSDTANATKTAYLLGCTPQATIQPVPQIAPQVNAVASTENVLTGLKTGGISAKNADTSADVTRTGSDPLLNCAECGETLGELNWLDHNGEFGTQRMCLPCVTGGISGRGSVAECLRCDDELRVDLADGWTRTTEGDLRQGAGALITRKGAIYCRECAPSVEICRECGCTQEFGCQDINGGEGCDWAERNADRPERSLCTACVNVLCQQRWGAGEPVQTESPEPANDAVPDDEPEPDVNNDAPLCGCGEPTCLGICGNKSPDDAPDDNLDDWSYPAPESMDSAKIIDADKMDAGFCRTCSIRPVAHGEKDCAYCIALFFRAGTGKEASIGDLCKL